MDYKQKIIIVNNNLNVGGVQKALVNLLNEIKEKYEVTLFIFSNSGEYKRSIPKEVKIIEANSFLKLLGISQSQSKKEGLFLYIIRSVLVIWTRLFNNYVPFQWLISTQKKLKDFDVAISYLHSSNDKSFYGGCNEFVLGKIDANKKIAFIHGDYLNFGGNTLKNQKTYKKFDKIAAVSDGCKKSFIQSIPELSSKTFCVKNFHNYNEIKIKADDSPIIYNLNFFNIVTVARLGEEKGIIRTINVIAQLVKKNYKICWHIVGEGDQRKEIEELIVFHSLRESIILYGNQDNPYRYMKNADLFLLPSYHEAAPMVFDEAKCLGLPILATKTTSTKEMVEDCNAGWICENSTEGIQIKLEYILNHVSEFKEFYENLRYQKFDNKQALEQFNCVLEGDLSNV